MKKVLPARIVRFNYLNKYEIQYEKCEHLKMKVNINDKFEHIF